MVLIEMAFDSEISRKWMVKFVPSLQAIVGQVLQIPTGRIGVRVRPFSRLDIHQCDIEIAVNENDHPHQNNGTQQQQVAIAEKLAPLVNSRLSVSVLVRVVSRSSYGEFRGLINDCTEARKLLATIQRGNGLAAASEFWLRNHATSCGDCRAIWESAQALLLRQ